MPKLFGNINPVLSENLSSNIFSFFDPESLTASNLVCKNWKIAAQAMLERKQIFYSALLRCDFFTHITFAAFTVERISGGLTNVTYKVSVNNQEFVVRIPGKQTSLYINRAAEYHNASITSEAGINAQILFFEVAIGTQITRFLPHPDPMTSTAIKTESNLKSAMTTLHRLHHSKKRFLNDIDVFARNKLLENIIGEKPDCEPAANAKIKAHMQQIEDIIKTLGLPTQPCHNDTTPTNFVLSQQSMHLIDWEYSGNNYPLWDLVCLALEANFTAPQMEQMLLYYFANKPEDDMRHLFQLLIPVYEYWVALWAGVQLTNKNYDVDPSALIDLENLRRTNCLHALEQPAYKLACRHFAAVIAAQNRIAKDQDLKRSLQLFAGNADPLALTLLQPTKFRTELTRLNWPK